MNKITKIALSAGSALVFLSMSGGTVFAQMSLLSPGMMMNGASKMVSSMAPSKSQATVMWPTVSGAAAYNIYYKEWSASEWTHSVPGIPQDSIRYTINDLVPGRKYQYMVTAVDNNGLEFWTSGVKRLM